MKFCITLHYWLVFFFFLESSSEVKKDANFKEIYDLVLKISQVYQVLTSIVNSLNILSDLKKNTETQKTSLLWNIVLNEGKVSNNFVYILHKITNDLNQGDTSGHLQHRVFGTQTCTLCEGEDKDISTLKYITIRNTTGKYYGWLHFSFPSSVLSSSDLGCYMTDG